MIPEIVGKRIEQAREEAGLTQKELASSLGMHYNQIGRWENGSSMPRIEALETIAQLTNKDPLWFFSREDLPVPQSSVIQSELTSISDSLSTLPTQITASLTQELAPIRQFIDEMKNQTSHEDLLNKIEELLKKITLNNLSNQNHQPISKEQNKNKWQKAELNGFADKANNIIPFPQGKKYVPVYHQAIGAGYTLTDYHPEDLAGFYELPMDAQTRRVGFIAPVRGDSMSPEITDGAVVFIEPKKDFRDGDKVIAYIKTNGGELTLKYAYKIPHPVVAGRFSGITLQGFRDDSRQNYKPEEIEIQGVVIDWVNEPDTVKQILESLKTEV